MPRLLAPLLRRRAVAVALVSGVVFSVAPARANPRPLPFSYPYETLPEDGLEVEQIVDLTPISTLDGTGNERTVPRTTLTTEFEYGITSRLELGLYIQLADDPAPGNDAPLRFDGLKQRLRFRLGDPGAWPVDVALYGEIAELRDEFEVEAKVILQRRLGPVRLVTNLWVEREFYYQGRREWVFHPTLGAAYEFGPRLALGLEGWLLRERADGGDDPGVDSYNAGPLGYLGPTLFAQGRGHGWLSAGVYRRITDFGRSPALGDHYGRYWIRMMLGLDL